MNRISPLIATPETIRRRVSYKNAVDLYHKIENECQTPGDVLRVVWQEMNTGHRFRFRWLAQKTAESIELLIEEREK